MALAEVFLYAGMALTAVALVIVVLKSFGTTKIKRSLVKASHQLHLNG